jgi:hypothetical protein
MPGDRPGSWRVLHTEQYLRSPARIKCLAEKASIKAALMIPMREAGLLPGVGTRP